MNYYRVAVNSPFNDSILSYSSEQKLDRGDLVWVPLGKREIQACVLNEESVETLKKNINLEKIKPVNSVLSSDFKLSDHELTIYEWIAKYYHYPLGQAIFGALPKIMKKPRKLNFRKGLNEPLNIEFTEDQSKVIKELRKSVSSGFSRNLLHGITGSGKTIIYLELINEAIKQGKSVLFLLPEINLTPQFLETFERHLKAKIYSYHSGMSQSDKFGLWKLLKEDNSAKVIIGVRSSIFLPIENLEMIIVDEEHDQSFKQDDRCPYNARDIAIKKANLLNIPVILGSATPSLESFANFYKTKNYYKLMTRPNKATLPEIQLIDMKEKSKSEKQTWPIHSSSIELIEKALAKGEQVLVFINKLGYASFMQCRSCGHQFECPNCHTNLRVHKHKEQIHCHICDYKNSYPDSCPACGNMNLINKGFGTEKVKEVLEESFPSHKVARFDRDEITTMTKLEDRLKEFHRGDVDILVGTQMMSKGHNFKKVNLVLILGIDSQLNFPDFRSNERVYQTLAQVSGRSGRFGEESCVAIQTLAPENKVFDYITNHCFNDFYLDEIEIRKLCECPPFKKIVMFYFNAKTREKVVEVCERFRQMALQMIDEHFPSIEVMGPRPAFIEKKVNRYTWSAMIKSDEVNQLHNFIASIEKNMPTQSGINYKIDVDPFYIE